MKFYYNDDEIAFSEIDYVNNDPDKLIIGGTEVSADDVEIEFDTIDIVDIFDTTTSNRFAFDFTDEKGTLHTAWGDYKNGILDLSNNTVCYEDFDWCLRISDSEREMFADALKSYIKSSRALDSEDRYEEYLIATRC